MSRHVRARAILSWILAPLLVVTLLGSPPLAPHLAHADGFTIFTVNLETSDGSPVPGVVACLWLASAPTDVAYRKCAGVSYDGAVPALAFTEIQSDVYILRFTRSEGYGTPDMVITISGPEQTFWYTLVAPGGEDSEPTAIPTAEPTEEPTAAPTEIPLTPAPSPTDAETGAPPLSLNGQAASIEVPVQTPVLAQTSADAFLSMWLSSDCSGEPFTYGNEKTFARYAPETVSFRAMLADLPTVTSACLTVTWFEPVPTATATETATPTVTATVTPTATASDTPVPPTPIPTATDTPTETPSPTSTPTDTPTETPSPTYTPTHTPTETPSPTATSTPTPSPTDVPTATPSPSPEPPTAVPTETPTAIPTATFAPPPLTLDGQATSVVVTTGTSVHLLTTFDAFLTVWQSDDCTGEGDVFAAETSVVRFMPVVRSVRARLVANPDVGSACLTVTWIDPTPTATETPSPTSTATTEPTATETPTPSPTTMPSLTPTITETPTSPPTVPPTWTPTVAIPPVLTLNGQPASVTVVTGTTVSIGYPTEALLWYWMADTCDGPHLNGGGNAISSTEPRSISYRAVAPDNPAVTSPCLTVTWLAPTPTVTATFTATATATVTASPSPSATSTATDTPAPTIPPTPTDTLVPSATPSVTVSPTPTSTSSPSPSPTPTATATAPLPSITTTPSPTATPTTTLVPPTLPPLSGTVTGTGGVGVNCRAGAGTNFGVIVVLREGESVLYRGPAQQGWQPVTCAGRQGWISAPYLRTNATTPAPTAPVPSPTATAATPPAGGLGTAFVDGTGGLGVNCRTGAGTSYAVITALPEGQSVPLRGAARNGWQPVVCSGRDGFILGTYLRGASPPATTTPTPTPVPGDPTPPASQQGTVSGTGGLGVNCRSGAGMSFGIITALPEGTRVPVRGPAANGWVPVRCAGRDGWISASYLRLSTAASSSLAADRYHDHGHDHRAEAERNRARPGRRAWRRGGFRWSPGV